MQRYAASSALAPLASSEVTVSTSSTIDIPETDEVSITCTATQLTLSGTIAVKDPREPLGAYFRELHEAIVAAGQAEFVVDVSGLKFVNSSAIRLFVDWATWLKQEDLPYRLVFRGTRAITWQRTTFMAVQSIAKNAFQIEYVA
jgi:hypothetical protein